MTTRELIYEDENTRIYEVRNAEGVVIGRDIESKLPHIPSQEESVAFAARLLVVDKVRDGILDDESVAQLVGIFPEWAPGLAVEVGDIYSWDGTLVEVVQAHTTQDDLEPDMVPALFKIHRAAGQITAWVQPTGAQDTYDAGAVVTHNGETWDNVHGDGNSWEPGVFGWVARLE